MSAYFQTNFAPTQITGLQLWLDASDDSTVVRLPLGTSTVDAWIDKSGKGNNATTIWAEPPYIEDSAVIFEAGKQTVMNLPDNTIPSGNSAYSVFVVLTPNDPSTTDVFLFSGESAHNRANGFYYKAGMSYTNYWYANDVGVGSAIIGTRTLVEFIYTRDVARYAYNNGGIPNVQQSSGRNSGVDNNTIGGELARNLFASCSIHEILIFGTDISTSSRIQIEGYLAWKWALAATLPPDHPYREHGVNLITNPTTPLTTSYSIWWQQTGLPHAVSRLTPILTLTPFFTPPVLPGLALWYDAADTAAVVASGGVVTQWKDKGSSGYHLTGYNAPTTTTYNGRQVILLNGGPYLQNTVFTNTGPYCVFFFMKASTLGGPAWLTVLDNVSPLRPFVGGDGVHRYAFRYGGTFTTAAEIWSLQYSASDLTTFAVNGTDVKGVLTTLGVGIGHTNGIRVGLAGNNTAPFQGIVGEIIYYTGTLTGAQIQTVEGYLAWKWGTAAALPPSHPFKLRKP